MTIQTYGWSDLTFGLNGANTGTGAPALTVFGPTGNIKQWKFAVGDSLFISAHISHDILVGSTCYPHVHWATDGTSTTTVKWHFHYTTCAGYSTEAFPADSTVTLEAAATNVAWTHEITEDAVGFVIPDIDSIILVEIERVTNGGAENTDGVFGLFVDLHYQVGQVATPSRSPNFWA